MEFISQIHWQRHDKAFEPKTYDRSHKITLGSGTIFEASSAPDFLGNPSLANPEELFTAALSSCLMLTFLYLACVKKYVIDDYSAEAIGKLAKNEEGKMAMVEVIIKPKIRFEGTQPSSEELSELFKKAHENCFISSSVKTKVTIE